MNLYTWFAVRCCSITEHLYWTKTEFSNPHIYETNLAEIVVILIILLTEQVLTAIIAILEDTEVILAAVTVDISCALTHFKC